MLTSQYPIAYFSDCLQEVRRDLYLEDDEEYDCLGIRLYGNGGFVRETKPGMLIRRKRQWRVKTGDVVYNKLFAWKGAFCIADDLVSDCIASDKFPTYEPLDNVDPDYLALWFRTEKLAAEAAHLSKGAAALSKFTLNPPDFWKLPIPLPSRDEQTRVVERARILLRALQRVEEARAPIDAVLQGRRAGVGSELRLLMSVALRNLNDAFSDDLNVLDDALVMRPRSGPSFPCSEDGVGIPVIMPSALGGYRYDRQKCQYGDGSESIGDKDILLDGDLLITRGNKRDQVGLCVVYNGNETRTFANLIMRMQVDQECWCPTFVKYWLMSPIAVGHIRRHTKGTSPSVQKINQRDLVKTPFPASVPMGLQDEWVAHLDKIFAGVDELEKLAREEVRDVEVARKAILAAAFKGEL